MSETPTISQNEQTSSSTDNLTTVDYLQHYGEFGVESAHRVREQREASAAIIDLNAPDQPFVDITSDETYTVPAGYAGKLGREIEAVEARPTDAENVETIRAYTTQYVMALRLHAVRSDYTLAA